MSDLPGADQNPFGVLRLGVRDHGQKALMGQIVERRERVRMPQHALGREHDQGLPPLAQRLPTQQVEILSSVRGLTDLDIVSRRQLQEALYARTRMFRTLAFVAVRQ